LKTDTIKVIEGSDGYKTYTFGLNLQEFNKLTNVVIKDSAQYLKYRLVEYKSENFQQWLNDVKHQVNSFIIPTSEVTDLEGKFKVCDEIVNVDFTCPSGMHSGGQLEICDYDFSLWSLEYTFETHACLGGGGAEGGSFGTSPHAGGGGGGQTNISTKTPCNKIKDIMLIPNIKDELIALDSKTSDVIEWGKYKLDNSNVIQNPPANTFGVVTLPPLATGNYSFFAHSHNSPSTATYSIFSWADLEDMAILARNGKLEEGFVTFLMTADGTRYALTIANAEAFGNFFSTPLDSNFNNSIGLQRANAMNLYYDPAFKGNPLIKENSTDNIVDEKAFLDLVSDNNLGVTLFETNATFTTFDAVTHDKTNNTIVKTPCN
jgi:hypothetical protein